MAIFQNWLSYLEKKKTKTSQNRNSYQKVATPVSQTTVIPAQFPCCAGVSSSKGLWWLPESLSPQVKGEEKADRNEWSLSPDMCLAQPQPTKEQHDPGSSSAPTTPGQSLNSPSHKSSGSGMKIAARLLWGIKTNTYFKCKQWIYSKVDFSHLRFRRGRGAASFKGQCGI